jgi:Mlc titration factor MtfA (ptsG expression regulator)
MILSGCGWPRHRRAPEVRTVLRRREFHLARTARVVNGRVEIDARRSHVTPVMSGTLSDALPMLTLAGAVLAGVAAALARPRWTERRRDRLRAAPFPAAWRRILRRRVPAVARLPADLQVQLKRHIQVFIAEKPFIGCQGQAITADVQVTVAAQACMLLMGHARPDYFPRLRQILVYPDAFVVQREQAQGNGLVHEQRRALTGESWSQGQVILSWTDVLAGASDPADGRNVVLHEFAHQIDQDNGTANGRPWRPTASLRRRWAAVMGAAFEQLRHEPSALIDAYGASEPAEFFAVLTEVFFERPQALAAEAPAVYRELAELYRLQPASW